MTETARIQTALLLAAGVGSRLGDCPDAMPKCLVEVGGLTLLQRMILALRAQGITRLVIVVGFRQELIREAAAALAGDMQLDFLVSDDFATTNNIVSLWLARGHITEPFLLLESDLVFDPGLLAAMMVPDRAAVSSLRPWMQGTRVSLGKDDSVESFLFPPFSDRQSQFKTINIYSLSRPAWQQIGDCLDRYVSSGRVDVYYEYVFAELLEAGAIGFEACRFPQDKWYEVDTPADHAQANKLFPDATE